MDDLLIFANTKKDLENFTRRILQCLRENDLFLKPEKCEFEQTKLSYLGMIIEEGKLSMDPSKLAGIRDWPIPTNVKQVRSFLGFGNFYRKFIRKYAETAKFLNELLKKDTTFLWNPNFLSVEDVLENSTHYSVNEFVIVFVSWVPCDVIGPPSSSASRRSRSSCSRRKSNGWNVGAFGCEMSGLLLSTVSAGVMGGNSVASVGWTCK